MAKVVVGIDLTSASEAVLAKAVRLAGDPREVFAVHVFEPARFVSLDSSFAELSFEEGTSITEAANEIRVALEMMEGSLAATCRRYGVERFAVVEGKPAHELHVAATREHADTIVVGASETNGWSAMWTATTHAVLRGAKQDVLAVRSDTADVPYRRILVALDTSDAAPQVLAAAVRHAGEARHTAADENNPGGVEVHTVSVVNPVTRVYLGVDHLFDESTTDIEAAITRVCRRRLDQHAASYDIPERCRHVRHGDRVEQIRALAHELDVDLLVIGSHGTRGVALWFGSTPNAVLRHIESDVLAVHLERADERETDLPPSGEREGALVG